MATSLSGPSATTIIKGSAYKVTLKDDIIGDTSGMYQKLCLYVAEY